MSGYVAKDNSSCGFRVSKYGSQQYTDYWRPDCGNGVASNQSLITGNDATDTSLAVDETFAKAWVQDLVASYGLASAGGVSYYALDNEPDLWASTHRDVHPTPQSYDELGSKGLLYAAAIKSADPSAKIFGYSSYGWTAYWYSELDSLTAAQNGYTYFPDYATHGNVYQVPWFLQQFKQYDQAHSKRLLDYLDLHFYPDNGVALTTAGDASRQALRLRSIRSMWDPTYIEESWIGGNDQPSDWRSVHLIPRMRAWVDANYPGTKLAITEYNFGGLESINGALAQADVLGVFGREALDLATLWNYGDTNLGYDHFQTLPGAYAFRMYRNYDGNGGKFGNTSLSASSADASQLAIYAAQRSSDAALTLMVINKTGQPLTSGLTLSNFSAAGPVQVYTYSGANLGGIVHAPNQAMSANTLTSTYPANSITLLVIARAPISISGNAGVGGVRLGYVDGGAKFVLSAADGTYVIKVPYNWSGTVKPSKSGVFSFSPGQRAYANLKTNQTAQNYRAIYRAAFVSLPGEDGYLRESAAGSGAGGWLNSTNASFMVGDDALNRGYRGLLSFNMASLPDNAVFLSAVLQLRAKSGVGTNPLNVLGSLLVDIKKPYFGSVSGLGLEDYKAAAGMASAGSLSTVPAGSLYACPLLAGAYPYLNRGGLTQLRVRFQQPSNLDHIGESLNFSSANDSVAALRPQLLVTYYLP